MSGLAYEAWLRREQPALIEVLRADPELRERAKRLGVWLTLIAQIEAEEAK